jgi:integrase/recombinase XerD
MKPTELEEHLKTYLAARLAVGYRDNALQNLMQDFVRYVNATISYDAPIRAQTAFDWACATSLRNGASRLAYRLSAARGFMAHLRASVPDTEVPALGLLKKSRRRIPYLFSEGQVVQILNRAAAIEPATSMRPHTYETMLGLMASTGIRVGEAIYLKTEDVKLDTDPPRLEIRESKFRKSRFVPLHPTTAQKLKHYAGLRLQRGYDKLSKNFFVSERQERLCYETLRSWFARTTLDLGMRHGADRRTPTLHGLRHYFAVERLTRWCHQGAAAEDVAPTLSVYMGHVSPAESYWYLTSTPALLKTAGDSFQRYAASGGEL